MRWFIWLGLVLAVALAEEEAAELPLAEECDPEACKLPDCRCSSTDIPGDLAPRDTPQFVVVSFNEAINVVNIETFRSIFYDRRNSNGCPAGVTFYIRHEYTNYALVNELYNRAYEIGLNSISWRNPVNWWADATYDELKEELVDQRVQMAHFANIPLDAVKGLRLPFLQMSGNTSFQVMADHDIQYDYSWSTLSFQSPGLWPYTLDYASIQDCVTAPCPTASIPKPWVAPIIAWTDLNGFFCSMLDACFFVPELEDEEGWFRFILTNFERHYFSNRAPFSFSVSEGFIAANPAVRRATIRFFDLVNNLNDVFMVTAGEVIDWVKNPVPVDEYKQQACRSITSTVCPISACTYIAEHNNVAYWLQICNVCPRVYPWVGNPLGQ